jgi:hypothetical protein
MTPRQVLAMPAFLIGTEVEMAAQIRHRHRELGVSYLVVSQSQAPLLVPVMRHLAGEV